MTIYTLADEYEHWALGILRRALAVLKDKRRPTMVKLLTVSDNETAVMFAKVFTTAKNVLASRDNKCVRARDYAVLYRREGIEWSIYLDNTKPAIRRIQRERRRK